MIDYTDELEATFKTFVYSYEKKTPEDRTAYALKGYVPVHRGRVKLPNGWTKGQYYYRCKQYHAANIEQRELLEAFTGDPADLLD